MILLFVPARAADFLKGEAFQVFCPMRAAPGRILKGGAFQKAIPRTADLVSSERHSLSLTEKGGDQKSPPSCAAHGGLN